MIKSLSDKALRRVANFSGVSAMSKKPKELQKVAVTIDEFQGYTEDGIKFGYLAGDDGGWFFKWYDTDEEILDSLEVDEAGDGGVSYDEAYDALSEMLETLPEAARDRLIEASSSMEFSRSSSVRRRSQEDSTDDSKVLALAEFLGISPDEVEVGSYSGYEAEGGEYEVMTNTEADVAAREYIIDSLWAFNPEFLVSHTIFSDDPETGVDIIQTLQRDKYEDANPLLVKLVTDMDYLVEDAIGFDGRGHFLATYDGEEGKAEIGGDWYFIYRTN